MPQLDENAILDLGRKPIAGGAPCGIDAAEDEQYTYVVNEIAKLDRIEAEPPDFYQIEQSAANLLTSKTKDFEIASILGIALFKRHGYAGLSAGLGLLVEMVNAFWDGAFPERPRRRRARIEFLTDRFSEGGWFRENQPKSDEFDAIDVCQTRIEALDAALKAKMPDDPPQFQKFIQGIKEHAGKKPAPAAPPPSEGAPAGAPSVVATGGGFAAGEIADASSATSAMLAAASYLRKADPSDPVPYAIVRAVKWSRIALPASDAARTQIEPPDNSLFETLNHQFTNAVWENLLKNAEAAFRSADPLWLDLQRYVCAAMAGLGSNYQRARAAVMSATAGLVRRLGAGLFELRFRNGTPLCSGETRLWVDSEVAPPTGKSGPDAGGNGRLAEASDKARQLASGGQLKEALEALRDGAATCSSRREQFLWRLQMAQLCLQGQRLQLAAPLLEDCYEDIRRHHVDAWEPALAVETAQMLYRCRKAIASGEKQPPEQALQRVRDAFAWLCQLDPLAALAVEPSGK